MDVQQTLMAVAALLIWGAAVWAAAQWWFGRKLRRAAAGQDRTEKARQFAAQQAAQARKQIEALQKEVADLRLAAKRAGQHLPPVHSAPAPLSNGQHHASDDGPPDGFADTQVQMPFKRSTP